MTTYNHTDIATGAAANAVMFNGPLGQLDEAIKKNNYAATAAPTINDDAGDGYSVGSRWFDTTNDRIWECVDATAGAAVWKLVAGFIGARVYNNANISINSDAANFTTLTFNSEIYDTDGIHSTSVLTDRLTCQTAGYYYIAGQVSWAVGATGRRTAQIKVNATTILCTADMPGDAAVGVKTNPASTYYLNVGDYVTLEVAQSSGAPLNVLAAEIRTPVLMMHRIGG